MANNSLNYNLNVMPNFHANHSGANQQTDHTRATGNPSTGNVSSSSAYSGVCSAHYGSHVVYKALNNNGMIPAKIQSSGILIYADDINSLKNILNMLIDKWVQGGATSTYTNQNSFSSKNENISATNISPTASSNTILTTTLWQDVLNRLEIFTTVSNLSGNTSLLVAPANDIKVTKANYNNLINSIVAISKACKCNSDCACNMVCVCNADCGCNYS